MKAFKVVKPGLLTTIQDLGRYGYLKYGVPISGAMDQFSCIVANKLVGNDPSDACLETTLVGPELEFLNRSQIAITGGECNPMVNEESLPMWQTFVVNRGDVVSFDKMTSGCRAYLALRGGANVPLVLGSRSTYVRGRLGGVDGRPLRSGDIIEGFDSCFLDFCFSLSESLKPKIGAHVKAHAMLGPQEDMFTDEALTTFFSSRYTVTPESDRMGYRLEGLQVRHKSHADIVSDALLPGSVQVPMNGKPILIMRDAQTTGGYPKIAVVVSSDLPMLGQAKPNDMVYFAQVALKEAHRMRREYTSTLANLESMFIRD